MKNLQKRIPMILGLIILASLALSACVTPAAASDAGLPGEPAVQDVADSALSEPLAGNEAADVTTVVNANGLTDAEIAGLLYMREEEKLAHDVYLTLYDLWGLKLFQNIARSEQSHTEAVQHLLVTYGIADPAEGAAPGVFTNPDLQALYDELTAAGAESLEAALRVGAAIEEIDILDLQNNLTSLTNKAIRRVYENLLKGSKNHLRAFTSNLARQTGEAYEPQYLSDAVYNAILGESTQNNSNVQKGGRGGGRRP